MVVGVGWCQIRALESPLLCASSTSETASLGQAPLQVTPWMVDTQSRGILGAEGRKRGPTMSH